MTKSDSVHLSTGFATTTYENDIPSPELQIRAAIALFGGIVPFTISFISLKIFKNLAAIATLCNCRSFSIVCGVVALPVGAIMLLSAKIFGLTQKIGWGKYAKNPSGDGLNTRLAWYGVRPRALKDFVSFTKAFFTPQKLTENERSLEDWGRLQF